jgi:hypothetical protein
VGTPIGPHLSGTITLPRLGPVLHQEVVALEPNTTPDPGNGPSNTVRPGRSCASSALGTRAEAFPALSGSPAWHRPRPAAIPVAGLPLVPYGPAGVYAWPDRQVEVTATADGLLISSEDTRAQPTVAIAVAAAGVVRAI